MAKKVSDGRFRRVAEGVYERNGSYYVPIWERGEDGKAKKVWHGPNCNGRCDGIHEEIVDRDSARDAKRALEVVKRKKLRGRKDETVKGWAARWQEVFPRKNESTTQHNEERIRSFVKDYGDRGLRSLAATPDSLEDLRAWALEHPSCMKVVNAMLNDAMKIGLLVVHPFANLRLEQGRGRSDIDVLTDDELALLVQTARGTHADYGKLLAAMIEVAAWTGLRPGELFVLARRPAPDDDERTRVNWVDFKRGEVVVDWQLNSKTGKRGEPKWASHRRVALLPAAERALMSIADDGASEPIFRTPRGKVFTQRTQFYYWDPIRTAFVAQLPAGHWLKRRMQRDPGTGNFDFYELRHFFGTKLAQPPEGIRPASPYEIAQQMGHKDGGQLAMKRYCHINVDQAIRSLRDAWNVPPAAADEPEEATG